MGFGYDEIVKLRDHEVLDFQFDWYPFPDGDNLEVISQSQWIQENGFPITIGNQTISSDQHSARVILSGTRPHSKTIVANIVTTSAGRTYEYRLQVLGI